MRNKKLLIISLVIPLCVAALFIGLFLKESADIDSSKQAALEQLAIDQELKAEELSSVQAVNEVIEDDVSDLQFTDISSTDFKRPNCDRLENRAGVIITSNSCAYKLKALGNLTMAVIFLYEDSRLSNVYELNDPDSTNTESLEYINQYLEEQSKDYNVTEVPNIELTYFGPYEVSEPMASLYYRDSQNQSKILEIFNQTSSDNKVPEDQYDMIHFIFLDRQYGGLAFPGLHRALTYRYNNSYRTTVGVFIHETLHLLGASDKYTDWGDCYDSGDNNPFDRQHGETYNRGYDIMCHVSYLNYSVINDITAREIGWQN